MTLQQDVNEAYELALELCGDCLEYHATRPFLVASGVRGGPERDRPVFEALLRQHVSPGSRLLIAGAADAGLLQFVHGAVGDRAPRITVIDKCPTPLTLCRRLGDRQGIALETVELDINAYAPAARFDVIVAHAVLHFVAPASRPSFLARLANLLTPEGVLITAYPVRAASGRSRRGFVDRVLAGLAYRGVTLPDPDTVVLDGLRRFEQQGETESVPPEAPNYDGLLAAAGLEVMQIVDSEPPPRQLDAGSKLQSAARRYAVARRATA